MTIEHAFQCPTCWQSITMVLDLSEESAQYVEDCEVCCRPIQITFTVRDGELAAFQAEGLE